MSAISALGGAASVQQNTNTSPSAMENIGVLQKTAVEEAQKSGGATSLKDLREKLSERIQNDGGVFSGISQKSLAKMFIYRPADNLGQAEQNTAKRAGLTLSLKAPSAAFAAAEGAGDNGSAAKGLEPNTGCKTCESRVYQDGSDDPGVSFQTPGHVPTSMSGIKVAAHEGEHATREPEQAKREGRIVTNTKVTMQMAFCPDCHRMYAAGGTTTTTTAADPSKNAEATSLIDLLGGSGEKLDDYM